MSLSLRLLLPALAALIAATTHAGEATIAVAANFSAPMQKVAAAFEAQGPHRLKLVTGSTGAFYTQVRNGAPFDVLLSADDETPARLEQEKLAVPGTRFTYATGRLVLWSAQPGVVDDKGEVLRRAGGERVAIANPKLAPYGAAAVEAMDKLGVADRLRPRLLMGENITHAFQFVVTGNALLGFIALSQVYEGRKISRGSGWIVPANLHHPLKQDAVLLTSGKDNEAAKALLAFLKTDTARAIAQSFGYE